MPAAGGGAEASTPLSAALARIDARNRPITAYSDCGDQASENSTRAFVSSTFLNATPGKLASAWLCCASVTPKPVAIRLKTVCLLAEMGCSGIPTPITICGHGAKARDERHVDAASHELREELKVGKFLHY